MCHDLCRACTAFSFHQIDKTVSAGFAIKFSESSNFQFHFWLCFLAARLSQSELPLDEGLAAVSSTLRLSSLTIDKRIVIGTLPLISINCHYIYITWQALRRPGVRVLAGRQEVDILVYPWWYGISWYIPGIYQAPFPHPGYESGHKPDDSS